MKEGEGKKEREKEQRGEWKKKRTYNTLLSHLLVRGLPKLCQCSITGSIAREVARKPPARDKGPITAHLQYSLQYGCLVYELHMWACRETEVNKQ